MASDSRPTEPVSHHARVLSAIVASATATETASKRFGVSRCHARASVPSLLGRFQASVTRANLRLPTCTT